MKKLATSWTIKQWSKMFKNEKISFDYPIQRQGDQWDLMQKSLLICSLVEDYPVPAIYSIKENEVYFILDGKQRLTNIFSFLNGDYALHVDTPPVIIEGKTYPLAEMIFEELHEEVKDSINDFMILNYRLDEADDETIENVFYRLNNGTSLTKSQKARAKMGTEWANKIKILMEHPFMKEKASFTNAQIRKADDETAIIQTIMLLDDGHELKSISSNHVFDYTQTFKDDEENKNKLVEKLLMILDYLNESFDKKETLLSRKVNFPMLLLTALTAINKNINPLEFAEWTDEFKKALKETSEIKTNYKEFGGAGSVKKEKTLGRLNEMQKHFENYLTYKG